MKYLKHIATLLFILFPLQVAGWFILPFVLPFVPKDKEVLPDAFKWFDNAEIRLHLGSRDDGLAGPSYYRTPRLEQLGKYFGGSESFLTLTILRYIWLGFRNPINYFQYKKTGIRVQRPGLLTVHRSMYNPNVGNKHGDSPGLSYIEVLNPQREGEDIYKKYWELYYIKPYPFTFRGKRYCFRLRMGWKIDKPKENKPGDYIQWVLTPGLFAEYEGL